MIWDNKFGNFRAERKEREKRLLKKIDPEAYEATYGKEAHKQKRKKTTK